MSRAYSDSQAALLARMAETRTALLAACAPEEGIPRPDRIGPVALQPTVSPWFLQSPNAELIAATLVAFVILGVRRTVQGVATAGVSTLAHRAIADAFEGLQKK
ncbi:hypothetical protein [Caballeronia sp. LZ034LL]|uniref:hypothetical protein n=1 Tax=Caballeronia sp. LZ034LL TaxID=3038567 RepID=UPI002862127A|nr:hypothetical protein [Caballeronia sp. LZ034LL]MDR5835925.1 hypothetical protein [Caballeronia sp. LZ034LL]